MRHLLPALLALSPLLLNAQDMRTLIDQYGADGSLFNRHWAPSEDSAAALTRERNLWETRQKKLTALDFAKLRHDQQVDYILMRNDLAAVLNQLRDKVAKRDEIAPWLPFRAAIEALGDARVANQPMVPEKAAAALAPLPKIITDLQARLKAAREKKPAKEQEEKKPATAIAIPTPVSGGADGRGRGQSGGVSQALVRQL